MAKIYEYKVRWARDDGEIQEDMGFVAANDFSEAADRVAQWCGGDGVVFGFQLYDMGSVLDGEDVVIWTEDYDNDIAF